MNERKCIHPNHYYLHYLHLSLKSEYSVENGLKIDWKSVEPASSVNKAKMAIDCHVISAENINSRGNRKRSTSKSLEISIYCV
jgi:hypothetical protein